AKFKLESVERKSRNLLSATLSAIREGVITADDDLTVQFMNPEAVKMAGSDRARDRKVTVQEIFLFRDSTGKEIRFKELISSPAPFMASVTAASVSRGTLFPAELSVNRFSSSGLIPGGYVFVIRDKSEEHRYRTMESTLASIVNASEDAIIGIDWEGTIVSWNSGAERMLGYSSGEIIGKNAALLTPSHLPSELPSLLDDLRVNRKPENLETVWQGKSGSCVDVQTTISVIPGPESENTLSIIGRNITERKQLERRILEISEEERRRLGRDLHDSLGQHLAGTLFQSRFLHSALEESGKDNLAEQAGRVEKLLEEAVTQCRDIAKGFFPTALESEGLPGLLEELSHFTEQVYGIPVEADIHTPVNLENGMSIQLFRIAQEAVTNAARHGKPDRIILEFRKKRGEYILKIQDNGAGLHREETSGLGLKIMQYRAGVISGLLEIHSPPGGGTAVICRVPFREDTDE
ncbi:MAG: PAS domain S-box protein, partial [Spirochaetia bacterium]